MRVDGTRAIRQHARDGVITLTKPSVRTWIYGLRGLEKQSCARLTAAVGVPAVGYHQISFHRSNVTSNFLHASYLRRWHTGERAHYAQKTLLVCAHFHETFNSEGPALDTGRVKVPLNDDHVFEPTSNNHT